MDGKSDKTNAGLLAGLLNLPHPPSKESQELWAEIRKLEIERRHSRQKGGIFTSLTKAKERDLLKVQFAISRNIALSDSDWEQRVIHWAAYDHPELDPMRRQGPGRPKKIIQPIGGLLSGRQTLSLDAAELLDFIEAIRQKNSTLEKPLNSRRLSDPKLIEIWLTKRNGQNPDGTAEYKAVINNLRNKVTKERNFRKSSQNIQTNLK